MTHIKTTWDFDWLYKGITDPKLDRDMKAIEKLYAEFAKKYGDRKFVNNAKSLKAALDDWNTLDEKGSAIPLWYLELQKTVTNSPELQAASRKMTDRIVAASKQVIFFDLAIAKIPEAKQKAYLKDKSLVKYAYLLQTIFDDGKHMLSEPEEKIIAEKASVAYSAWKTLLSTHRDAQTVKYGKKTISISEAMSIKADLPRKERRALHHAVMQKYKDISFVAEGELNAIVKNKSIDDSLRGYKTPYERTIKGYQNDVKSIENLVSVVTKSNSLSHRFFALKAKIINGIEKTDDKTITMAELATGIARAKNAAKNISFEESVAIVKKAFNGAGEEFGAFIDRYLENGQIDVFPRQNKRVGAFCWKYTGSDKTYVLLNHAGKLGDISTFAHEMGHAIHSDFSKSQPAIYQDYTTSVAEVASTFFEHILLDELLQTATPEQKRDLLVTQVQDRIFTIHAQIAYFKFEDRMHRTIREKGFVSKEELAQMFVDCRKSYVGDAVEVTEEDGYGYVYIPHFRSFFYVYAYAYGQLIADALYAEYKKDKKFIEKIKVFLRAGGSMSPEDIWKSIGIDTTKQDFFKKGLKVLERDLEELEKMEGLR